MAGYSVRQCPVCTETKKFRNDCKSCGCAQKKVSGSSEKPQMAQQTITTTDKTLEINLPGTTIHTLDQLIAKFQVDLSVWECKRFVANKWEVVLKPPAYTEIFTVTKPNSTKSTVAEVTNTIPMWQRDKDNTTPLHESLYQVKAFFEKKFAVVAAKRELEELKRLGKDHAPVPRYVKKPANLEGGMLEINFTDHHFGKLSWGLETGYANYDVKISTQVFHRALDTTLDRSPFSTYKEIWFVVGNDLFNADDTQGRTTSGTQVESDVRHEKTYVTVRTILIQAIEKLRHLAGKVKVVVVPGNHDHNATWHLGDSLEVYFSKYDDVEVDNHPCPRKYHTFGQTLIMYTHGDKGKIKDLPLLMAAEKSSMFGATKFHEIHTGHIHTLRVDEQHGIRVRTLPALCPPDAWHAENGYVGNLRSSESFVWDEQEGLIGIVIYTDSDEKIERASETPTVLH